MTDPREANFPIFGVVTGAFPSHAHVWSDDQRTSLCGFRLRKMTDPREAELPTCTTCADAAVEALDD